MSAFGVAPARSVLGKKSERNGGTRARARARARAPARPADFANFARDPRSNFRPDRNNLDARATGGVTSEIKESERRGP